MRLAHGDVETSHRFSPVAAIVVALLAVAALVSFAASPAGAVVARIGGHGYGLTPVRGVHAAGLPAVKRALQASGTSTTPVPYDKTGQLVSHGGPVMHSVATHVIYWDPNGEFTATTKGIVHKFFTDVAHDSGSPSNVFGVAGQYKDGTGHALYASTFETEATDASAYGTSGCTIPNEFDKSPFYSHCITDAQLQTELSAYVTAHSLHKGPTDQYFVLLPHNVVTCLPEEEGVHPCSNNFYCAYHSSINPGTANEIIYSDIPFSLLESEFAKACQSDGHGETQDPNGDTTGGDETTKLADVAMKYTSHEYIEASTDPLGNGWWENANGQEIGDKCNFAGSGSGAGEDPNAFLPTLGGSAVSGSLFNQSINSDSFYLQSEWDNAGKACLMKPMLLSSAAFTHSPASQVEGEPMGFKGSVVDPYGDPGFSWSFGDGSEATGPSPSHTYAKAGVYKVTMTPKDALTDSTAAPVEHEVTVTAAGGAPTVVTKASSGVSQTAATLTATVNPNGGEVTDCKFEFGTTTSYGSSAACAPSPGAGTSAVAVSAAVAGLSANTAYHFRAVATNATGTSKGGDLTLKTLPSSPTVETNTATAVTQTGATLNAAVNPNGGEVSGCKLEYGTTTSYASSAACAPSPGAGTSAVAVSAAVAGLSANTTYHFRVVATNPGGTSNGGDLTLKTLPSPPTVETKAASAVTQTAATLNATVNPNGGEVSECKLEYGGTVSYGSNAPCSSLPGSVETAVAVSAALTGLTPDTTYHFRIVATNPGGTGEGADHTFSTLLPGPEAGPPPIPAPPPEPAAPPAPIPAPTPTPSPSPTASLVSQLSPTPTPPPDSSFTVVKSTASLTGGAITFTTAMADPGTFSWLITFQNGKFGVFAASAAKCKKGLIRLNGRCRPARIVFAKGSRLVAASGSVSVTVRPSASAVKALKNAFKRHSSIPLSAAFTFQSSHGGNPVSHNQVMFAKLEQ